MKVIDLYIAFIVIASTCMVQVALADMENIRSEAKNILATIKDYNASGKTSSQHNIIITNTNQLIKALTLLQEKTPYVDWKLGNIAHEMQTIGLQRVKTAYDTGVLENELVALIGHINIKEDANREASNFPFTNLPQNMQYEVMIKVIDEELASLPQEPESLKIAAEKIRELALSNKDLNAVFNRPYFCLRLIKDLSKRFNSFDDEVVMALGTKCAQDRLKLQDAFWEEIGHYNQFSAPKFEEFFKKGIDLEWTANGGKTPLMHAVSHNKLAAVKALIKKGANVNYLNRYEENPLYEAIGLGDFIVQKEDEEHYPKNQVAGKKVHYPTSQIVGLVQVLLDAGANPEAGYLKDIKYFPDVRKEARKLIEDAQAKKHAQQ